MATGGGCAGGDCVGSANIKMTISLSGDQIQSIRALVAAGKATSVSAFVSHAIDVALFDAAGSRAMP